MTRRSIDIRPFPDHNVEFVLYRVALISQLMVVTGGWPQSISATAGRVGEYLGESRRRGVMAGFGGSPESSGKSETGRLEAFSDGVLAVIITIMAFELKAPVGDGFASLGGRVPALLVYILSFTFVGIYWNNHHHLLRAARRVTPGVMWANLHLLFWLSLIPVLTEWIGEHYRQTAPVATYGVVCLGSAVAFTILVRA